ncbi:DUF4436 family protein [Streptomyces sp. WAC01280]|uniref:DUF4436 family protein n=1 Tax=Streptomyces sp. WAC01280 TaxID=2487424 RepID=UPI000E3A0085|nr:DUF4436 family protein [Streptomyces sp. WAC01280]RSS57459.1 DUF4436 domain-containing protein [Streptomyces sp. WAC01280]
MASCPERPVGPREDPPKPKEAKKNPWLRRTAAYACWIMGIAFTVLVLGLAGTFLYTYDRDARSQPRHRDTAEIEQTTMLLILDVVVEKVDLDSQQVVVSVNPVPAESLANGFSFAQDVKLAVPGFPNKSVLLAKDTTPTPQRFTFPLRGGPVSEYPLDAYSAIVSLTANTSNGAHVPISMDFVDGDPFFVMHQTGWVADPESAGLEVNISRSRGTWILAGFIMVAMWALALAVLAGSVVLARKHEGLVWPALGWMAATLFALVSLRNAAPGSPPIGSLIDYATFFWTEGIITASLACTAMIGFRDNRKQLARGIGRGEGEGSCTDCEPASGRCPDGRP